METALLSLWLPVLLSALAVFVWNFLTWGVLPNHAKDWDPLPNEEAALNALRALNLPPGAYGFPHCADKSKRADPAFVEKWKRGPCGMLNIWPSTLGMGGKMLASFVVYLAVSVLVAYIASETLAPATKFMRVMQITGTTAILGYCFAFLPNGIWFNASKRSMLVCFIDGLVAGVVTGLIFAALWPAV